MIKSKYTIFMLLILTVITVQVTAVQAQKTEGEAPNVMETLGIQDVDNQEWHLIHKAQQKEAIERLQVLEKKFSQKPNILIFLVDDMGWGDLGVYGGGIAVGAPTPNIDRMAREGLRLTSTYSQPMGSPTRATLMTGRLPIRHGIYRSLMYGEKGGINDEITAASLLQKAGYTTALVGQWHLGEDEPNQPQNVGFDEFYGFLSVANIYTEWRDAKTHPNIVFNPKRLQAFQTAPFNKNLVRAKKEEELQNIKEITIPVLANIDQDFANYTVDFIERQKDIKKPFYLIHAFSKLHFDNYPAEGHSGKSPARFPYKDSIVEVDEIVGRILNTLKEAGLAENTLVFFTSDNGINEDAYPDSGHAPWRGARGSTWEGGVRVPGIAWWPGTIKALRESDGLFDLADLFNTSLALVGIVDKIPKERFIDSIDQTSFLLADSGESNRPVVYHYLNGRLAALRFWEYKYHLYTVNSENGAYEASGSMDRGIVEKPTDSFLFNLWIDPREKKPKLIRNTWIAKISQELINRHTNTFKKYPAKPPVVN